MQDKAIGIDRVSMNVGIGLNEKANWNPRWTIEKYNKDMKLYDVEVIDGNLLLDEGIAELLNLLIGSTATPFDNANSYIGVGDGNPTSLTGTLTFTNGSVTVTGSGTSFTSQVEAGDFIGLTNDGAIAQVLSVDSNTSITLASPYSKNGGTGDAIKIVGAVATQTGLQATTNKSYSPMDASFPQVTGKVVTFRATFGPDDGNHDWREFTVANGNSDSAKNLNRKVEAALRTKANPDTWVIQLQVTIL